MRKPPASFGDVVQALDENKQIKAWWNVDATVHHGPGLQDLTLPGEDSWGTSPTQRREMQIARHSS